MATEQACHQEAWIGFVVVLSGLRLGCMNTHIRFGTQLLCAACRSAALIPCIVKMPAFMDAVGRKSSRKSNGVITEYELRVLQPHSMCVAEEHVHFAHGVNLLERCCFRRLLLGSCIWATPGPPAPRLLSATAS